MRLLTSAAALSLFATPVLAEPPDVVTDFAVTGSLVDLVLGELGESDVLIGSGDDPHSYQMRPSDARSLQSADLLVWIGPELTPWMERASGNLANGGSLQLLQAEGTQLRTFGDAHEHDEHHDEHEHHKDEHAEDGHEHGEEQDHAEGGHDHAHDGTDPHVWLNPENAARWLTVITASLSDIDPDNAEVYRQNADAAAKRIAGIEAEIKTDLEGASDMHFAVFHDAYGYFTSHFGLQPAIAVALGDATSPSAARISEIRDQLVDSGANCAFPEYGHDQSLIDSATEGLDITIATELDPAGRGLKQGPELYENLLKNMGKAFSSCLIRNE